MLFTSDISRLTGYTQQTVQRWMKQDKLRSVKAKNKLVVAKELLIDFYCEEAYKIIMKSKKHIELMDCSYEKTEKIKSKNTNTEACLCWCSMWLPLPKICAAINKE